MRLSHRPKKKMPRWIEPAAIVLILIMAIVETINHQWFFACIFAATGVLFALTFTFGPDGGRHDKP